MPMKLNDKIFDIEVLKWEVYQHHHGKKTFDWFKVKNTIFDDPEIESLSDLQLVTWIRLLTLCSRYRRGRVNVSLTYLRRTPDVPLTYLERALLKFNDFKWITIHSGALEEKRREEKRRDKEFQAPLFEMPEPPKVPLNRDGKTKGGRVWEAYAASFRSKYGVDPKRNATTNSQAKQLVARLGADDAIEVVKFFLQQDNKYYQSLRYGIGICLKDAEKIYAEWKGAREKNGADIWLEMEMEKEKNEQGQIRQRHQKTDEEVRRELLPGGGGQLSLDKDVEPI